MRAFNYQRMIDRPGKPVDRAEWGMSPNRECLLQPSSKRNRLPSGDFAPTILQSECG